jgi:hypothetical protein
MKKKADAKQNVKLNLSRETLRRLEAGEVKQVVGGSKYPCPSTGPCPIT